LESEWTEVHPKYQRQGIMSTMYAYAKMLGNSVKPSEVRSPDAKAAWASWRQAGDAKHLTSNEGVAEDLNEFSSGGRDPWGDDDRSEDPYGRPEPQHYRRSSSYFEQFEADHFDDEVFDETTGVFKGYWDDAEGRVQIAYFKFDNPKQTGGDDPGMGWYYEPQNESVDEGWKQNLAALGLAGLTALAPTPAAAAPTQTSTVSTVAHGTTGDQIVNHKNYKKYYDQALAGRNTARAHQTAQQIATLKVKADIAKGIKEQGPASSKEADYGPEYQDMVKRVGQRAKQGPLKTVWDPVKRVYKNVPVNKDQDVDEASLATMRDYFAGNLDAQDPTKISQMRKFFAKQNVPAKEKIVKKFHNQDEYQQWVSKVKPMATNNVREAGPYSRGYYNPSDDERREQEYGDRSNRDWKHRERAEEESSVLYKFDPSDGKLKQRMWSHAKFGQARSEGYKDTPDQAMKALGYFPSKFKSGHYVKKGLDGKWETVFPYAKKSVDEAAGTISLSMNDGSTKMLRSGAPALNSVKSALNYLVKSKDIETLKNLIAIDGQDVRGIIGQIFKPSNTIKLGEALDTEFQNFLKQAKHRYPDSKDENEAFMRFVHDELEKEGRIDRGQSQDIDHLEAKIDNLIADLSKMNKPSAPGL
jgi:hypothetical protein